MTTSQLTPVSFHGDSLYVVTHKNEPHTPMKPIVENMGLTWSPQRRKLNDNKDRWGVTIMITPTKSGDQEMLCMPVRKLPAFFGTVQPNRIAKQEIRERIILYQNECDDVLWKYWTGQQVEKKELSPNRLSKRTDPERKELTSVINAWVGVAPIHYAGARSIVNAHIGVKTIDEMTVSQVSEAINFVQLKIREATSVGQTALPNNNLPVIRTGELTPEQVTCPI